MAEIVSLILSEGYAVILYLLIINALGFILMAVDKRKAKKNAWRIAEKTFFIITALFGGIGCLLGMYTFRHKTKHWYFVFGIPAITVAETAAAVALIFYFG